MEDIVEEGVVVGRRLSGVGTKSVLPTGGLRQYDVLSISAPMFEPLQKPEQEAPKPLPVWLRMIWVLAAPLGLAVSARILWEKTLLTAELGEQSIGWAMIHIHPGFFFAGLLCSAIMLAWLLPALIYLALARLRVGLIDYAMMFGSLVVLATMLLPDNFGLKLR